jgi:hypothetical protein
LLDRAGALVKSPGVPAEAPVVLAAREREDLLSALAQGKRRGDA